MPGTINLGGARAERAAKREIRGGTVDVVLDDDTTLNLPVELPIDTLKPLRELHLDRDFGGLFQLRDGSRAEQFVRDLFTVRPELVSEALDAGTQILERLMCTCASKPFDDDEATPPYRHEQACQWAKFTAWRPSPQDLRELLGELWREYGTDLGEAFAPAGSAGTGGATSNQTSDGSTPAPTQGTSGETAATPAS